MSTKQNQYTESDQLRNMVKSALEKNMFESAIFYAERLSHGSVTADHVLYAQCFFKSGQYRRCLAILEHKGFLSANRVSDIGKWIYDSDGTSSEPKPSLDYEFKAVCLAAQSLFSIDQYEDCVTLLQPLVQLGTDGVSSVETIARLRGLFGDIYGGNSSNSGVNDMAGVYCLLGRCYDLLEHRARAVLAFRTALRIDIRCIEAGEYIADNGLLTQVDMSELYADLSSMYSNCWLMPFYKVLLMKVNPSQVSERGAVACNSASWLARQAEHCLGTHDAGEAYRLARQAYSIDPYDTRCQFVYIASMVELQLKPELFYLGHELVNSFPKKPMSWYAVGCYYWCCAKYDLAQKNLLKATKLDKRFSRAWVLLGHVMSCQEESEQAISAYRTAARLLPGDHRPMVFIAKELARSNHLTPALHMLAGALEVCPDEPGVLNELGVTYLKQGSMDLALQHFGKAVNALEQGQLSHSNAARTHFAEPAPPSILFTFKRSCGSEIFSNYATALRKCERYEEALYWYDKCLATSPNDANCHAAVGFTFHMMQRFDLAVSSYHQALAIQPNLTFCADMLSRVMEDMSYFPTVHSGDPAAETELFSNFTRLSSYHLGGDPLETGELDRQAAANRSMNETMQSGYGYGGGNQGAWDGSYEGQQAACDMYGPSIQLSEMLSPGLSVAESYSQIEGRLSVGSRGDFQQFHGYQHEYSPADDSFSVSGHYRVDNGGTLNDSY